MWQATSQPDSEPEQPLGKSTHIAEVRCRRSEWLHTDTSLQLAERLLAFLGVLLLLVLRGCSSSRKSRQGRRMASTLELAERRSKFG